MAAVNCDEESNKAFCGGMGVKGFPTLKIVKPSKSKGKPIVEDYQGARTANAIIEAVKLAIPNNVKRLSDKTLASWLESGNETSKVILFSDKGTTSALIKVLANDFIDTVKFAQIRNKETAAVAMFGINDFPTLLILPGGSKDPLKFDGSFTKEAMKEFIIHHSSSGSVPPPKEQKPLQEEQEEKGQEKKLNDAIKSESDSASFSSASSSHASTEAFEDATKATTIKLGDPNEPTGSPDPKVLPEDAPKPIVVPDVPAPIPTLVEEKILQEQCLGPKTSTCVLALLPAVVDDESSPPADVTSALSSLAALAGKHTQRGGKLFPFFSIPAKNTATVNLRDALKLAEASKLELVAINARRGWWKHYKGKTFDRQPVEDWVDAIRFGEGEKSKLPDGLIAVDEAEKTSEIPKHEEL